MKRIVIILVLLFGSISLNNVSAQTVKIIKCNTPNVTIGDKKLSVGDSFDLSMTIKWSSKNQVVIIKGKDGRAMRLAASASENGKQDIISKLLRKTYSHLSTRGDDMPQGLYYLEDSLMIPIDLEENIVPQLRLLCTSNGSSFTYVPDLSNDCKFAIIHNDIFEQANMPKIECKLIGTYDNESFDLSDLMILIPLENALDIE